MNRSTTMDKVVGIIFALFGACSLIGAAMSGVATQVAGTSSEAAQASGGPPMILSVLSGVATIAAGIGVFMAARWGFLLGAVLSAITLVYAGYAIATGQFAEAMVKAQAAQPAATAQTGQMMQTMAMGIAIFTMVLTFAFGAYFVWRLTSK